MYARNVNHFKSHTHYIHMTSSDVDTVLRLFDIIVQISGTYGGACVLLKHNILKSSFIYLLSVLCLI